MDIMSLKMIQSFIKMAYHGEYNDENKQQQPQAKQNEKNHKHKRDIK